MEEIWKKIPGFQDAYEASTFGRLRRCHSFREYTNNKGTYRIELEEMILKTFDTNGSLKVSLFGKQYGAARLIAQTFLEKSDEYSIVKFKNNIFTDLHPDNLYWQPRKSEEHKKNVELAYSRKFNKTEKRRQWYKAREKHPDYLAHLRSTKNRHRRLSNYTRNKRIEFDIDLEYYSVLLEQNCYYCNKSVKEETGSSLDRVQPGGGYLKNNVVTCCGNCNKMKSNVLTKEEMVAAMKAVLELRCKYNDPTGLVPNRTDRK